MERSAIWDLLRDSRPPNITVPFLVAQAPDLPSQAVRSSAARFARILGRRRVTLSKIAGTGGGFEETARALAAIPPDSDVLVTYRFIDRDPSRSFWAVVEGPTGAVLGVFWLLLDAESRTPFGDG
jgi:hypothetical protein